MKQSEVRFNLDGLEDIKRQVGRSYRARVGILGSGAARDDAPGSTINNATLGLIQMFGSLSRKIPARDFLLMPIQKNQRELIQSLQSGAMRDAFTRHEYKKMFALLGLKAEELVQRAFETGGFGLWKPLKAETVARKGSSKPLIDTGQLRKSISSDVVNVGGNPQVGNNPRVAP